MMMKENEMRSGNHKFKRGGVFYTLAVTGV